VTPGNSPNDSPSSGEARLVGLDAARGMLLVLGIVLHAANIYTSGGKWVIADSQSHYDFDLLVGIIHEFRMPTFFWISGYFCALTLLRSGARKMLKRRVQRLVIPLFVCWITLNVIQTGFVAWWNGQAPMLALLNGVPLFHLWFLVDLLVFTILAPLYLPWLQHISHRMKPCAARLGPTFIVFSLGLFGYLLNLAVRATDFAYNDLLAVTSLHRLSINLPFFLGGALMYYLSSVKEAFLRIHLLLLLVLVPLALLAHGNLQGHNLLVQELNDLSEKILVWGCIGGCLHFFNTVFKHPTWLTRLLADASYTVFLFSHCLIVVTGLVITQTTLPIGIKFLVVSLSSLAIATWIHVFLIRRFVSLRFAFNGH
jgi:glucan biosynthesis protein C